MSVLFALVACLAWGYSTYEAGRGSRAWGALRLTTWSQAAGLALMVPWLAVAGLELSRDGVLYGLLGGIGTGLALLLLYDACVRMSAGLASAVSAVTAAVVPLAHVWLTGSPVSTVAVLSMTTCVGGVAIIALTRDGDQRPPALPLRGASRLALGEAAASGAAMGFYYLAIAMVDDPTLAVVEARAISAIVLLVPLLALRTAPARGRAPMGSVLAVGLAGAAGSIAYAYAADGATLIAVVAILSVAPAVTAWLGRLLSEERLGTAQAVGLLVCVAGAALAAVSTA
jgi:drug/metabolite transporter (DMT)-like permease